jgi:predicted nucleotide-binding protein
MNKKSAAETKKQDKPGIIAELEHFRTQLMRYFILRRKVILEDKSLTNEDSKNANSLYEELGLKAGRFGDLLNELTGLKTIAEKETTYDIWYAALSTMVNPVVTSALDMCIQSITRAIGKLETDIKLGIRDEATGRLTVPVGALRFEVPKAFISRGKETAALKKLEEFLYNLGIIPLTMKEQPGAGEAVPDKAEFYIQQSDFVIVLATGDDEVKGKLHARENVVQEIGLAQKTHPGKIIYLLEEEAEFPASISPGVWVRFKQGNISDVFLHILQELRAFGILVAIKPQKRE